MTIQSHQQNTWNLRQHAIKCLFLCTCGTPGSAQRAEVAKPEAAEAGFAPSPYSWHVPLIVPAGDGQARYSPTTAALAGEGILDTAFRKWKEERGPSSLDSLAPAAPPLCLLQPMPPALGPIFRCPSGPGEPAPSEHRSPGRWPAGAVPGDPQGGPRQAASPLWGAGSPSGGLRQHRPRSAAYVTGAPRRPRAGSGEP